MTSKTNHEQCDNCIRRHQYYHSLQSKHIYVYQLLIPNFPQVIIIIIHVIAFSGSVIFFPYTQILITFTGSACWTCIYQVLYTALTAELRDWNNGLSECTISINVNTCSVLHKSALNLGKTPIDSFMADNGRYDRILYRALNCQLNTLTVWAELIFSDLQNLDSKQMTYNQYQQVNLGPIIIWERKWLFMSWRTRSQKSDMKLQTTAVTDQHWCSTCPTPKKLTHLHLPVSTVTHVADKPESSLLMVERTNTYFVTDLRTREKGIYKKKNICIKLDHLRIAHLLQPHLYCYVPGVSSWC